MNGTVSIVTILGWHSSVTDAVLYVLTKVSLGLNEIYLSHAMLCVVLSCVATYIASAHHGSTPHLQMTGYGSRHTRLLHVCNSGRVTSTHVRLNGTNEGMSGPLVGIR